MENDLVSIKNEQNGHYEFYLGLNVANVILVSKKLSPFVQDYVNGVIVPYRCNYTQTIFNLGLKNEENGLLAVVKQEFMADSFDENILGNTASPVLRYDPKGYKLNEAASHALKEGVLPMERDSFLIDHSDYFFRLKPDFSETGVITMLKEALAMQRFLQRVSEN
jgi:hypothetical protein